MKKLFTDIKNESPEEMTKENPFQPLYSWDAPERTWTPKTRDWYVKYAFFFVLVIALAALIGEYILIMAILAFIFLWFIQGAIPPEITTHKITTLGIKTFGHLYKWSEISHFWFSEKHEVKILNLDLVNLDAGRETNRRISLLLKENMDSELFYLLVRFADYGDKNEVDFNIIARLVHGKYIDVTTYLPEEQELMEEAAEQSITTLKEEPKKKPHHKPKKAK